MAVSPLLSADPSTLPPHRKGTRRQPGGLMKYIAAVQPGIPPFGWRDITPYFGGMPRRIGGRFKDYCRSKGYIIQMQRVTLNGQVYRRVAVALASHIPVTKAARKAKI